MAGVPQPPTAQLARTTEGIAAVGVRSRVRVPVPGYAPDMAKDVITDLSDADIETTWNQVPVMEGDDDATDAREGDDVATDEGDADATDAPDVGGDADASDS